MIHTLPDRARTLAEPAIRCEVIGFGIVETTAAQMTDLRQQLAPAWAGTLSLPTLRQADEQALVGLAAVTQARRCPALAGINFTDWGVLAAPRYFGRAALAATLERTRSDGPWGVSPHFVPHRSLHSLPGLLSLGLNAHGPNLGVGGGPDGESEVLLTAATFLHAERLPGVWVVLTAWYPEPTPTTLGQVPPDAACRAVALALTPAAALTGFTLRITCCAAARRCPQTFPGGFTLESLHAALHSAPTCPTTWLWQLQHGRLELHWPGATEENQR